jgi:hypothetical protein
MPERNPQVAARLRIHNVWIATFVFFAAGIASLIMAENKDSNLSGSWRDTVELAERLKTKDDEASFDILVGFLANSHTDIRYAAARSLEVRAQTKWTNRLIAAVSKMDADDRWFGYRTLGAYPTKNALLFLADALKVELGKVTDKGFDTRNYFYISQSIEKIVQNIQKKIDVATTTQPTTSEKISESHPGR